MNPALLGILLFFLFCASMLSSTYVGHRIALWQKKKFPREKHHENQIIEGAIFALMGLLIALTLAGAYNRFDMRRNLVVEEAAALETAYLRLDLLNIEARDQIRNDMKQYADVRLSIYQKLPNIRETEPEISLSHVLQRKIWDNAVLACKAASTTSACIVLLPAITEMINTAHARNEVAQIHPPIVLIITLVCLAILSAMLCGYNMHEKFIWHSIHILVYILTVVLTIFIIIDLEYPQWNFVQVHYFHEIILHVRTNMNLT